MLCRELLRHLFLCLPSGTYFHWFCQTHSRSSRVSHSWPSQHPLTLLDRLLCIFECLLLSVTVLGVKISVRLDIEINTRLVLRSRTRGDGTHHVKHSVVLVQSIAVTLYKLICHSWEKSSPEDAPLKHHF